MTREIADGLTMFRANVEVQRIALNKEQVDDYELPPNFAKESSKLWSKYKERFGPHSWELDALAPEVIQSLLVTRFEELRTDMKAWQRAESREERGRKELRKKAEG